MEAGLLLPVQAQRRVQLVCPLQSVRPLQAVQSVRPMKKVQVAAVEPPEAMPRSWPLRLQVPPDWPPGPGHAPLLPPADRRRPNPLSEAASSLHSFYLFLT